MSVLVAPATPVETLRPPAAPRPRPGPTVVLRSAPESRPPVQEQGVAFADPGTPGLFDLPLAEPGHGADVGCPVPASDRRAQLVLPPGGAAPRPDLPDPLAWCRTLAPALVEVLQRRRPLGQLARWLDDPVLGTLAVSLRLRQRAGAPPPPPGVVWSIRVQCPTPAAAEVSVHVRLPGRGAALAFRLVAGPGGRWLCTALDLGDATLLGPLPGHP